MPLSVPFSVRAKLRWPILKIDHDNFLSCPSHFVVRRVTHVAELVIILFFILNVRFGRWRLFHIRYKRVFFLVRFIGEERLQLGYAASAVSI
jgi:hypothetical protein